MLALFLFGGETLQDFAFALIIGTLSGAYSSIFIAGPVLVHWKEREPVYRTRYRRIKEQLGYVPAYAVGDAPARPSTSSRRAQAPRAASVTAPQDPTQVSREDFDDMVANLGDRGRPDARASEPTGAAAAGPARRRPPRACAAPRATGAAMPRRAPAPRATRAGPRAPAPDPDKPKKPRNRRHGRPR